VPQLILDVREPFEFEMGHVNNAVNIPASKLSSGLPELNNITKDTRIIVYCRTGNRSANSINILNNLGYKNVINGINQENVEAEYL